MNNMPRTVEVTHPDMQHLIHEETPVEQLCTGFRFSEGPIWNPREQCLYFSDMPNDIRRRWSPHEGVVEVRNPSNKCNGMTYDAAGNLYVCEHVTSALVMETPAGERKVLATHWQGKELNSPNDVVAAIGRDDLLHRSDLRADAGVRARAEAGSWTSRPSTACAPDGRLHCDANDFTQPNGLCFSPDERTLYVNDTERAHIRAFEVAADGSLSRSRVFFEPVGTANYDEGVVDGMKCDERGNVYVTGPRGIWVIDPQGRHLASSSCRRWPGI